MKENWDLSEIFQTPQCAESHLELLQNKCREFQTRYSDKIAYLSVKQFCLCLRHYADLSAEMTKIDSYAYLLHSTHLNDAEISTFYQNVTEKICDCEKSLAFFTTEIKMVPEWDLSALKAALTPGEYSWLEKCLALKDHCLSVEMEELFADYRSMENYWVRLYDETRAQMEFFVPGLGYCHEGQILGLLSGPYREVRHNAGSAMAEHYRKKRDLFALIFNALMHCRQIRADWHHFKYPCHEADLLNDIRREDHDNLINAIVNCKADFHRYYRIKAKIFAKYDNDDIGAKKKFSYWDRNAPYPVSGKQPNYTIYEAKQIVLEAFAEFSPEFAKIAQMFFDNNLVDYYPYPGKDNGAYCMEMPVGVLPRIFLNFDGSTYAVITMGHELGHAIHEYLSKEQGELGRNKSCGQAEMASIFAEQLVFDALLKRAKTAEEKRILLGGYIENIINTAPRQIAFDRFEQFVYNKRAEGELSADEFENAWMKYMKEYLGDAVDTSNLAPLWCSVPHFFQYHFYVYSYSLSWCCVNALYAVYASHKVENFAEKYLQMLRNGGVENYREALAHFGIDASSPDFGKISISSYIDEFEKLSDE